MTVRILVRGGGDLASGVVVRLYRAGWQVLVTELPNPLAVRRYVSFAQAIYDGRITIEDVPAQRIESPAELTSCLEKGIVPVLVDPGLAALDAFRPHVLVDGRMRKKPPETRLDAAPLVIGLGPGFTAGQDCHAVVETNRGPFLGRVIWSGSAQADTGIPERVGDYRAERVLRAPTSGLVETASEIGSQVRAGEVLARVAGQPVAAPFDGVLRGLVQAGLAVNAGEKIGDVDPRGDARLCWLVSDKSLSVGGGVLEAILSYKSLRPLLAESTP